MHVHTGTAAVPRRPAARIRRHGPGAAVAACLTVLLGAGCGSPDGGGAAGGTGRPAAPPSSPTAPASPSSPAVSAPSASPASPASSASPGRPSPPASSPPPAHRATKDLGTCRDGACTVEVREGTVIPFGAGVRLPDLRIDAVGPSGVDMTARGDGVMLRLGGQSPGQGGPSKLNETHVEVLAIEGDTAVLRLSPARG
ncbi:hypothetical protein ACFSJS_13735 [Streptomyces desertarenae]|uniref:DUF4232 domain-containing protein n=1 Tax=Streptomyces desertarenae TaxID=2666184 RepID=A0ABW4PJ58_9ACTN